MAGTQKSHSTDNFNQFDFHQSDYRLQTEFYTTLEEQEEQRATIALQYSRPHDAAQTVSNSSKNNRLAVLTLAAPQALGLNTQSSPNGNRLSLPQLNIHRQQESTC